MDPMSSVPDPTERPRPVATSTSHPRDPSTARSSSHPDPAMPAPASGPVAPADLAGRTPGADPAEQPLAPRLSDGPGRLGAEGLRPVSARLIPSRYVAGLPGYVIGLAMVIAAIVLTALTGWWWIALIGILPLALVVQGLALTPRRVRALGYRDGAEELTIASGILFREVSTIPYGRIQSAKIDEGPVDRRYGLAKLTMSTAAAGSTVTLPGLPKEEAERLRRLVTERGIEKMAAL